jgi:hypothetical protein
MVAAAPGHQPVLVASADAAPVLQRIMTATSTDTEPESLKNTVSSPLGVICTSNWASRGGRFVRQPAEHDVIHGRELAGDRRVQHGVAVAVDRVHHEAIASSTSIRRPFVVSVSQRPLAPTPPTGGRDSAQWCCRDARRGRRRSH